MKKIYSFFKSKALLFFLPLSLAATLATAQCGGIVEDFNSNSSGGFTGDFSIFSPAPGTGYLQNTNPVINGLYVVTTPTYVLPAAATSIGYGFLLNGTVQAAEVRVAIMYISTLNGQMETVFVSSSTPVYAGATATICQSVMTASLSGFPAGGQYRLRFEFRASTGTGQNAQNMTFDDFRTTGTLSLAPLPVNFIGFDARKISSGAQLNWKIAGEENVARYEVERSIDGRNFTTIATFSRTGKDQYSYLDATAGSTVYYRIKNVDTDGKFKYSSVARIVNGKSAIVLKSFPSPVQSSLTVQHPTITGNGLITVATVEGRVVRSVKPGTGTMQTFVDMSTLQKGMYMIRFDAGDGNTETMKIIKQ